MILYYDYYYYNLFIGIFFYYNFVYIKQVENNRDNLVFGKIVLFFGEYQIGVNVILNFFKYFIYFIEEVLFL